MINQLVHMLEEASKAYYNSGEVIMSNERYDALVATLRRLEPFHPFLDQVGAPVEGYNKVGRKIPMGTLTKLHTDEDVKKWISTLDASRDEILFSYKYDGFGVELIYENYELKLASTRGDGYVGEDVTEAVLHLNGVPATLPLEFSPDLIVRGEVIIPRKNHDKIKELGYTAMRNAIPGIVKSNRVEALELSDFVAYEFFDDAVLRSTQRRAYRNLFNVEAWKVFSVTDWEGLSRLREFTAQEKDDLAYEIDGVVLKTNMINDFGDALLCPKNSVAWKFKSNRRETILRGVEFQLGATGKFTPIGLFDPVEFQGAELKRASLGSMSRFTSLDPKPVIGSIIEVSRRGDIIPYIEEILFSPDDCEEISLTVCPHCDQPVTIDTNGEPICANPKCPEILRLKMTQYVKGLGVKGIGDALVRGLIESGSITSLPDIYKIDPETIRNLPRQGNSAVTKWRDLQEKEVMLIRFLSSYPLENIGEKVWDKVLSKVALDEFLESPEVYECYLNTVRGLGEAKVKSLVEQVSAHKDEIKELLHLVHII